MGHDTYLFYHPELDAVVAVEFTKPNHSGRDAASSVPRRGVGVCTSAAPTLEVPTGGSTQSMPTSRKGSLLPTLAPSSPATASPVSKIHWCSVRARDGRPGSAATFSISPARKIA